MSTTIIDFWREREDLWITLPSKQAEADELIYKKFWGVSYSHENLIGQIVYLDQFSRHFQRYGAIDETTVAQMRERAVDLVSLRIGELAEMNEVEIIFALMPFKHTRRFAFIFEYLHEGWLKHQQGARVMDFPQLQKFYIDTYKKAFTLQDVRFGLINVHAGGPYNAAAICDYHPERYERDNWSSRIIASDKLAPLLPLGKRVLVSLSGGVDSMVMLSLLAHSGTVVHAVHIVYGNRAESEDEYRFLVKFCARLRVPLWVYRIKWLRRGEVDRQFYEDMTRDLRFMAYRAVGQMISCEEPCVLMGHIKDDVVENIWTNIARGHHLDNLKKMEGEEVQQGVRIIRPFLGVEKDDIYKVSAEYAIPFLKNTTPSWSNRGKFRETFHAATVVQFGAGIDDIVIQFADAMRAQSEQLQALLYQPIYDSFVAGVIDITPAVKVKLGAEGWQTIFEHICHMRLGVGRPSIKCVRDFCSRLYRPWGREVLNIEMGKGLKVKVRREKGGKYSMEFIRCGS
jgi:tRNA(Ile)-lysidine synthetase-like protein